jgi:hypothetical protein
MNYLIPIKAKFIVKVVRFTVEIYFDFLFNLNLTFCDFD